jgi:hypothetical protein
MTLRSSVAPRLSTLLMKTTSLPAATDRTTESGRRRVCGACAPQARRASAMRWRSGCAAPRCIRLSLTLLHQLVQQAALIQGAVDVAVARRVPALRRVARERRDGQRSVVVAVDPREAGLREASDGQVVGLVLVEDLHRRLVGAEAVHQDQGDVDAVLGVQELDLRWPQVASMARVAVAAPGRGAAHGTRSGVDEVTSRRDSLGER